MNFKKIFSTALVAVMALAGTTTQAQSLSPSTKWHWDKGTIVVETPERPAGQEHVLNLAVAPIKTVRVAFVGLGIPAPMASLGTLISDAYKNFSTHPYMIVSPLIVLALLMLSFNLLADGLRDALDPKQKDM